MKHISIITVLLFIGIFNSYSQEFEDKGFKKYWNSLVHGNVDKTFEKKMDMSFVIAPSYTREGSFGIGGAATALYRVDRTDSMMQPSDISLSGNASINGFYSLSVKGNNNFRGNRARLTYWLAFQYKNLDFWGISYKWCSINPITEYTKRMIKWESDYVYKMTKDFHIGAALNINYTDASNLTNPAYLEGQKDAYLFTGIGLSMSYDTRDFILNPKRGVYFMVKEVYYPNFACTYSKDIFCTTAIFDYFQKAWEGGVFAFDLYGQFNGKNIPWVLREELGGGSSRMRGYYAGRYIDNNQIATQLELRQHIYSRIGCVAWVGGGTVFPSFDNLKLKNVLPNYGLGLRIEFKHHANLRIDYGFGKETAGFVFQFAEAF